MLKPYSLSAHAQQRYDVRLLHRRLHRTSLTLIDYGGEVAIDAGRMTRCYLLQVPVEGSYTLRSLGRTIEVKTRCAHIIHPGMPLEMAWSRDCRVLVFRFEETAIAARRAQGCRAMPESLAGEPICLDAERNRSLSHIIDYVTREATAGKLFDHTPQAAADAENLLVAGLMAAFDWRATDSRRDATPDYVRRAEEYVLEHLADSLTVDRIARAASAPARTLFDGFKRTHGTGPLAWMRAQRLDRARADLLAARHGELRVTDVAMRWGFLHIGRFCIAYRNRFGETPTATLHGER